MMARALEQRWPMTPEVRKAVVGRLIKVLTDPESKKREVIAASKALMAAEAQNQKDEHQRLDDFKQRIIGIAERCGIDATVFRIGETSSSGAEGGDGLDSRALSGDTASLGREIIRPATQGKAAGE